MGEGRSEGLLTRTHTTHAHTRSTSGSLECAAARRGTARCLTRRHDGRKDAGGVGVAVTVGVTSSRRRGGGRQGSAMGRGGRYGAAAVMLPRGHGADTPRCESPGKRPAILRLNPNRVVHSFETFLGERLGCFHLPVARPLLAVFGQRSLSLPPSRKEDRRAPRGVCAGRGRGCRCRCRGVGRFVCRAGVQAEEEEGEGERAYSANQNDWMARPSAK